MKDFDGWNTQKKDIDSNRPDSLVFSERDIWWCSIGINIGDEQDGKNAFFERPVLAIKKFNSRVAWVVPLTSKNRIGPYYYSLVFEKSASVASLSQLRLVSVRRFNRKVRIISLLDFQNIQERLRNFLK